MTGSPLCRRSLSFSLSFLSRERERDLQRGSLDLERRCRDLPDRDEERDRLLLGDLKHTRSHFNVAFFSGNTLILPFCTPDSQNVQVIQREFSRLSRLYSYREPDLDLQLWPLCLLSPLELGTSPEFA